MAFYARMPSFLAVIIHLVLFQFILRRQLSVLQFLGVLLIVVSIAVAKTPDIVQILYPLNDQSVLKAQLNETMQNHQTSSNNVNAIPVMALVLALVGSCNSGKFRIYRPPHPKSSRIAARWNRYRQTKQQCPACLCFTV